MDLPNGDRLNGLSFDKPRIEDGINIWRLIRRSEPLDLNSPYSYLLLCKHFSETCLVTKLVAKGGEEVVGFISAYRPPGRPDTLFVWQVAVDARLRRRGLGQRMLYSLLEREACRDVKYLEVTVTPSNQASRNLFCSLATDLGAEVKKEVFLPKKAFGDEEHEEEALLQIGPFDLTHLSQEKL